MSNLVWLVTDHHHPPRRLHLYGCEHLESPRVDYDPDWREATAEELASIPQCEHCASRAAKAAEEWGLAASERSQR